MNSYAVISLGQSRFCTKNFVFYAKRLKKACQDSSRNGPHKYLFILLQPLFV